VSNAEPGKQRVIDGAIHVCDAYLVMSGVRVGTCGGTYVCTGCERKVGWCFGAADNMPELCDECWAEVTQKREEAACMVPTSTS
jgi:hypothetical protein